MATIPNTGKKKAAIYSVKDRHYKQGGCYVKYSTQKITEALWYFCVDSK
jgi:hypothetical protein